MFEAGGCSYVYLIYGMYNCFNIVTGDHGRGEAVLIRALQPVSGLDKMFERRRVKKECDLLSGPGKICQAWEIGRDLNYVSLTGDRIYVKPAKEKADVFATTRIGISKAEDLKYRFYIPNCEFISKK